MLKMNGSTFHLTLGVNLTGSLSHISFQPNLKFSLVSSAYVPLEENALFIFLEMQLNQ